MAHVFTVDVEEYFHVEAFADIVRPDQWGSYPSRLACELRLLLDMLEETSTRGTFFVLGWIAQTHPRLIREIADRGHEIGCHSFWHRPVYRLTPGEFEADARRAKDVIEQTIGAGVLGYRAPSFSITRRSLWALDVLANCGFGYDASIFPIRHDIYGIPHGPRTPVRSPDRGLVVFPMTTFRWLGRHNWPVGGGGYLRLLPWWYTREGILRAEGERIPIISYIHPWELDPQQPRIPGRLRSIMRHYTNLHKANRQLRRLLLMRPFSSFRDSGLLENATVDEWPLNNA